MKEELSQPAAVPASETTTYWHRPAVALPANKPAVAVVVAPAVPAGLGFMPLLTLLAAVGLVAVAIADRANRSGESWGTPIFWGALAVCAVPFAYRLSGPTAGRIERIGLSTVFGLFLYATKVIRDPVSFSYADELVHAYNVNKIVATHALFAPNPLLPVTPHYPGLEMTAAAMRLTGGTSTFVAGLTVVAFAHLLMMLVLFVFFERVSGSSRVAGLATLLYAANPDFVFFDSAFSYEPLALPLALVVVYAIVRWMELKELKLAEPAQHGIAHTRYVWAAIAMVMTATVVVTHHLTSYLLVVFILGVGRTQRELRRWNRATITPAPFAFFALVATLIWLIFAARTTWGYLSPVVSNAVKDTINTVTGASGPRQLFSSPQDKTPIWYSFMAIGAALLITFWLPFGLRRAWKDLRTNAVSIVLAIGAVGYLGSLGLRLVPAAWEIANRVSEFLFIGVALVLALVVIGFGTRQSRLERLVLRPAIAVAFAIMLGGGIVTGWSANVVLAQANQVAVGGTTIRPQGYLAASWARTVLGEGHRFAADASNARLLAANAGEFAIAGTSPDVQSVIRDPTVQGWHIRLLRRYGIRYVLVDRRLISEDETSGYFFRTANSPRSWDGDFGAKSVDKFNHEPLVSRIFDSGNIVVYDMRDLTSPPAPEKTKSGQGAAAGETLTAPPFLSVNSRTGNSIGIGWASAGPNTVGYDVYNNGLLLVHTQAVSATASGLSCATDYVLSVDAYDATGRRGPKSSIKVSTSRCHA